MVVGIAAGPDRLEELGAGQFVADEGIAVAAYPPLYGEEEFMAAVAREARRMLGPGGEAVRSAHEAAAERFTGQLLLLGDRRFSPKGGDDGAVRATSEQLRLQRAILSPAAARLALEAQNN